MYFSTTRSNVSKDVHVRIVPSSTVIVLNIECCSYCVTANPKWLQPPNAVGTGSPLQRPPCRGRLCSGFALQFPGGHTQTVCFNTQGNPSFISCPGSAWGMDYSSIFSNSFLSTLLKFRFKTINNASRFYVVLCHTWCQQIIFDSWWAFNYEIALLITKNKLYILRAIEKPTPDSPSGGACEEVKNFMIRL